VSNNTDDSATPPQRAEIRQTFADAFDRSADPLKEFSGDFYGLYDPLEYFIETALQNRESVSSEETIKVYRLTYRQWREHMASMDRHFACPSPEHVASFIEWRRDVHGNARSTIAGKLNRLSQAYQLWQSDEAFPHPPNYNPFELAQETTDLGENPDKEFPNLSLEELREVFSGIENLKRRAVIGLQLKLGARAGEVCNIRIEDLDIDHSELQSQYDELGMHPAIGEHSDVLYIPHDRDGNKSSNPRLLPVDDELRWLLLRYLLVRPNVGEPWLFLSDRTYTQLRSKGVNDLWKREFHPEYAETEETQAITSHFGRHWFSSHWRLNVGLDREHVQYMRGDRVAPLDDFPDAIDDYLHPNYEHIERQYQESIFKLRLDMRY